MLIVSLFYSHFMLSISIFALVFLSIIRVTNQDRLKLVLNRSFFDSFLQLFKQPAYLAVSVLFFVTLISGINSADTYGWLDQLKLKIPFLAFPIIFLNRPPVSKTEYQNFFLCLVAVSLVSAVHVCINYVLNFEAITYAIGSGKTIPTPTHHTRYSVMVAIAILSIMVINLSSFSLSRMQKQLSIVIGIFLFGFLHMLSIRSGLLVLYVGIFLLGSWHLIAMKNLSLLMLFLIVLFLAPLIAYHTIPSFYNKVHYTKYDLKMNKEGKGENYSDSERLLSIKTGIDLIKAHPLLGTGVGDLQPVVKKIYLEDYKKTLVKLPHNQFVLACAAMGLFLGGIYIVCFFIPLLYNSNYRDLLLLSLFIGISLLCLVEKPLERSGFIAFYGFFVCAAISYNSHRKNRASIME